MTLARQECGVQPDSAPSLPSADAPRRTLVTGGAGFIGSHLVRTLLARGDRVTVIDNFSTGRLSNLPLDSQGAGHANLRLIRADLSAALREMDRLGRFDEIYHLAAAVGVKRIIERPIESIETNVQETSALLRFASGRPDKEGRLPATLIASSSEVYGKGARSPFSEDDDCVYGPTTALRWSYACSKALDEYLALAHHAEHGLPVVVARFFNTVGPRQVGEHGMVLPRFVAATLAGEAPEVFGDGLQTRCFCDVRDIAPALPKLLGNPCCHGKVFNIGSDEPVTVLELARRVASALGARGVEPRIVPYDRAYGPGFEDLRQRKPDLSRVRSAIGFEPRIPLERTIRDIAADIEHEAGVHR